MHDAFKVREDRHSCLGLDTGDETLAAARHDHVEIAIQSREHLADRRAVLYRHKGYRVAWQPGVDEARDETFMDAPRGKKAFRTATQNYRIAGLEAERAGVRRHRRAAFIDDADDAERGCNALDRKPVRPLEPCEHAAYRIGKRGDGVEAARHGLDAGVIES